MNRMLVLAMFFAALAASCLAQSQQDKDPCRIAENDSDQPTVLSDTTGVDFGPYLKHIMPIVQENWYTLIPGFVEEPMLKRGKVSVEFLILKDGNVDLSSITIQTSSGDEMLDRAAKASIIRSDPLSRLPFEFSGKNLRIRINFYYYLSPNISISPCTDVRVPAGAKIQFSASGKSVTAGVPVMWSVYGDGCWKETCGTISDNGLYTAPTDIPSPPGVFVRAKLQTDTNSPDCNQIGVRAIIVQANPTH